MKTKKPKLNPVAKLWVKALRSGRYVQCSSWLCTRDNAGPMYCCLGVLCALYCRMVKNIRRADNNKISESYDLDLFDVESSVLPSRVMKWAGISNSDGKFRVTNRLYAHLPEGFEFDRKFKVLSLTESLAFPLSRNLMTPTISHSTRSPI